VVLGHANPAGQAVHVEAAPIENRPAAHAGESICRAVEHEKPAGHPVHES